MLWRKASCYPSRHCKFTELLVIREHERIGHCGVSATLTQLRKNYWIPKGRQLVKTIIRICLICKKYNAKPADQLSGQLLEIESPNPLISNRRN
ncbi:integrase catalytic domain-containing protein [Trichonephila clavata]|uniref:Integrase catalytic domain-containing protein n=1 Tax=Trichonephila clavata TaxID=2740835 RepID=A0A8X6G1N9_TRICU|nr:integrase catalytic domain-containing protein [Trichonephila clavata]